MKLKLALIAVIVTMFAAGSSFAMMDGGGGGMGPGGGGGGGMGPGGGGGGGMGPGGGGMGGGKGGGMNGAGGMKSGMLALTMNNGFLTLLTPITTTQEAVTAVQTFITTANSSLQISSVWEYQTVYKAELSDTSGNKAFDVVADKLTGAVLPEMGFSMMMNASYGNQLQKTPSFAKNLTLTPDDATTAAQAFVTKNLSVINYTLAAPETYPGYYKFHTTDVTTGKPGDDIMVNGYNGGIWMNTQLGAPIAQVQ
jgi:hypothetical protein